MKNFNLFISDLKQKCKQHKIKLVLVNDKHIIGEEDNEKYGGWFDQHKKELKCAFPTPNLLKYKELLIHESCHLDQWINQTKYWVKCENDNSVEILWKWLSGKKIKNLNRHILNVQKMEAECEQMAVRKIIYYELPINIHTYIQKANSYLMLYTYLKEKRKWCDKSPYKSKKLYQQMPSFIIIPNLPMTKEIMDLYDKVCYKKTL